jgi:hypothetical protein
MSRKETAPARPRTGNRRNPLLHQAIIAAATEVLAKEGPTRFTIEGCSKIGRMRQTHHLPVVALPTRVAIGSLRTGC